MFKYSSKYSETKLQIMRKSLRKDTRSTCCYRLFSFISVSQKYRVVDIYTVELHLMSRLN